MLMPWRACRRPSTCAAGFSSRSTAPCWVRPTERDRGRNGGLIKRAPGERQGGDPALGRYGCLPASRALVARNERGDPLGTAIIKGFEGKWAATAPAAPSREQESLCKEMGRRLPRRPRPNPGTPISRDLDVMLHNLSGKRNCVLLVACICTIDPLHPFCFAAWGGWTVPGQRYWHTGASRNFRQRRPQYRLGRVYHGAHTHSGTPRSGIGRRSLSYIDGYISSLLYHDFNTARWGPLGNGCMNHDKEGTEYRARAAV